MGETCRAEDRAQATVEMAVVAPVMLVLALIVYNVMMFVSATARFDRVRPMSCSRTVWRQREMRRGCSRGHLPRRRLRSSSHKPWMVMRYASK